MEQIVFTDELIVMLAAGLLSVIFTYSPKLNTWFANKSEDFKKLTMLVSMVLITAVIFILGCTSIVTIAGFECGKNSAVTFVYYLILAIVSNQGVYKVSPQPVAVKQAKVAHFDIPKPR